MPADAITAFEPRKTPVQARAAVTVEAISEATLQVLLSQGADRLTTTRVAARAGVSVGTLYQYFPNKQALLFAVLENNVEKIVLAIETACEQACGKPLCEMIRHVVEAFVDAKMERPDVSVALYQALYQTCAELTGPTLIKRATQRFREALNAMLQTAPDAKVPPDRFAIDMTIAAMAGATRWVLETEAPPAIVRKLREQLVLLCQSYMAAVMGKG